LGWNNPGTGLGWNLPLIKRPRKQKTFSGYIRQNKPKNGLKPSTIRTLTVGCGITPHPALFTALVGFTTDREFHPAPKVKNIQL
jgi:hypothetical protein